MSNKFGQQITRAEGSAYFTRYIRLRHKHCNGLKTHLGQDLEAKRFYTGRLKASSPTLEDVVYVFDEESLTRLLADIRAGGHNSLMVFVGTRDEVDATQGETTGRPTVLLFPARKSEKNGRALYELSSNGEEHPGSGGTGGTGASGIVVREENGLLHADIPEVLYEDGFHIL